MMNCDINLPSPEEVVSIRNSREEFLKEQTLKNLIKKTEKSLKSGCLQIELDTYEMINKDWSEEYREFIKKFGWDFSFKTTDCIILFEKGLIQIHAPENKPKKTLFERIFNFKRNE